MFIPHQSCSAATAAAQCGLELVVAIVGCCRVVKGTHQCAQFVCGGFVGRVANWGALISAAVLAIAAAIS